MTPFDIFVAAIVGLSLLYALTRGFVTEALSLASWAGAVLLLRLFYKPVSTYMRGWMESGFAADVGSLLLLFFGALIGLRILAGWIGGKVKASRLGIADRILGGAFGVLRGLLVASLFYMLLGVFIDRDAMPDWIRDARSRPAVEASADAIAVFVRFLKQEETSANSTASEEASEPAPADEPGYSRTDRRSLDKLLEQQDLAGGERGD